MLTTGTAEDGPRARLPLADRLWKNVDKLSEDECWPWTGKSRLNGYGYIGLGGRKGGKAYSHRAAWIVTFGPIPPGEGVHGTVVMHTCDNRLCCNPAHLRLGTQADNVADMDVKGRRKSNLKKTWETRRKLYGERVVLPCTVDGCSRDTKAKGLCKYHYEVQRIRLKKAA